MGDFCLFVQKVEERKRIGARGQERKGRDLFLFHLFFFFLLLWVLGSGDVLFGSRKVEGEWKGRLFILFYLSKFRFDDEKLGFLFGFLETER